MPPEDVYHPAVGWQDKIRGLLKGKNASELARRVGLYPSAITDAVNTGKMPRADKAIKIARALGVPAEWLFDDAQEGPPPASTSPATLGHVELVAELARRRELIRRDQRRIASEFTTEKLVHLDRVAGFGPRSEAQRQELDHAIRTLLQCEFAGRQLAWLDPDQVYPAAPAPSGRQIVAAYPRLLAAFDRFMGEQRLPALATPTQARVAEKRRGVPRYDLDGETFPESLKSPSGTKGSPKEGGLLLDPATMELRPLSALESNHPRQTENADKPEPAAVKPARRRAAKGHK